MGSLLAYVFPVVFVFTLVFLKECNDDYLRYKKDKQNNMSEYTVLHATDIPYRKETTNPLENAFAKRFSNISKEQLA